MHDRLSTLDGWADLLRGNALPSLAGTPLAGHTADVSATDAAAFIETFTDEHGHRRAVDRPLLAHLLRRGLALPARPAPGQPAEDLAPDAALWWALHDPSLAARVVPPLLDREGPVTPEDMHTGIEIWTETELAALHALDAHARRDPSDARAARRVRDAARWHVETLQPDNATNHPWAAHVFARVAVEEGNLEARLHAETLVNIASVAMGRPDRFSACIMLESARALRTWAAHKKTRGREPPGSDDSGPASGA